MVKKINSQDKTNLKKIKELKRELYNVAQQLSSTNSDTAVYDTLLKKRDDLTVKLMKEDADSQNVYSKLIEIIEDREKDKEKEDKEKEKLSKSRFYSEKQETVFDQYLKEFFNTKSTLGKIGLTGKALARLIGKRADEGHAISKFLESATKYTGLAALGRMVGSKYLRTGRTAHSAFNRDYTTFEYFMHEKKKYGLKNVSKMAIQKWYNENSHGLGVSILASPFLLKRGLLTIKKLREEAKNKKLKEEITKGLKDNDFYTPVDIEDKRPVKKDIVDIMEFNEESTNNILNKINEMDEQNQLKPNYEHTSKSLLFDEDEDDDWETVYSNNENIKTSDVVEDSEKIRKYNYIDDENKEILKEVLIDFFNYQNKNKAIKDKKKKKKKNKIKQSGASLFPPSMVKGLAVLTLGAIAAPFIYNLGKYLGEGISFVINSSKDWFNSLFDDDKKISSTDEQEEEAKILNEEFNEMLTSTADDYDFETNNLLNNVDEVNKQSSDILSEIDEDKEDKTIEDIPKYDENGIILPEEKINDLKNADQDLDPYSVLDNNPTHKEYNKNLGNLLDKLSTSEEKLNDIITSNVVNRVVNVSEASSSNVANEIEKAIQRPQSVKQDVKNLNILKDEELKLNKNSLSLKEKGIKEYVSPAPIVVTSHIGGAGLDYLNADF